VRSHGHKVQGGFTLLELLVVVAILAIIGGGLIVAYDDLDDSTSEGVAAHTLAGLDSAVRNYEVMENQLPNHLDSLVAATYPTNPEDATTPLAGAKKVAIIAPNFLQASNPKGILSTLTAAQVVALNAAGITHLRYVDALANDPTNPAPDSGATVTINAPDANGNTGISVNSILNVDIPSRVFESARPGNGTRGRGFAKRIGAGDPVIAWNADRNVSGTLGGYDNTKIGAAPTDVVLIFGLGNDATNVGSAAGRAQIPNAPVYGKARPFEYGRYLLAVNVGPTATPFTRARLQVVMNTHGDFTDEMISEHSGQKP
jgi:prepilin-type N-terminal cleavage/methylation domain-containing protein